MGERAPSINLRRIPDPHTALMAPAAQTNPINTARAQFLSGIRTVLPLLVGVVPFGMIYGVMAVGAGIPRLQAHMMSLIVFAGSAQFVVVQLLPQGIPTVMMVLIIAVINLRHALYSASIAPHIKHLRPAWKGLLAYLLVDEAYAVTIQHFENEPSNPARHWFFLGTGLSLWATWQLSTAAGILLGAAVPASWSLDFTLALTFIAIVAPTLKSHPMTISALTAGITALLTYSLPYKSGLMIAALAGILAGMLTEAKK